MALKHLVKLEKLKISVYGNRLRAGLPQPTFRVMFNPESFSMSHRNVFQKLQGINTSGRQAKYSHSRSDSLSLELVFDGTGVADLGILTVPGLRGLRSDSVSKQIDDFLAQCFYMDGKLHEPKFLKIQWGEGKLQDFDCRLDSVKINYTSFDKSGAPLRATLSAEFVEDLSTAKRLRLEGKNSPDLSHTRVVTAGDTLPLLCKEIYGSSEYYIRLAQANDLDNFRDLTPGQVLRFPPLSP